jgi:hypothetical protein
LNGTVACDTIQAESFASSSGILPNDTIVGGCDNGDWLMYRRVSFVQGITRCFTKVAVPANYAGKTVEFRLDKVDGPIIGTLTVASTGGWDAFAEQSTAIAGALGIHDLYVVFKGSATQSTGVGNFDYFRFPQSVVSIAGADRLAGQVFPSRYDIAVFTPAGRLVREWKNTGLSVLRNSTDKKSMPRQVYIVRVKSPGNVKIFKMVR